MRHAELKPNLPSTSFPSQVQKNSTRDPVIFARPPPNTSRRRTSNGIGFRTALEAYAEGEDFDGGIDDTDLAAAGRKIRLFNLSTN